MRCYLNLNTVTLWAMWYTKYGPTTMQGWKGCDQLQTNQTITLTDARDNNQYTISKLNDGICWMTQNLKLQNYKLTPIDSDITIELYNIPASSNHYEQNKDFVYIYSDTGYYTFQTSSAGESMSKSNSDVNQSICPKGWGLPSSSQYSRIRSLYGSSPSIFSLSGIVQSGSGPVSVGRYGYYTSSTICGTGQTMNPTFNYPGMECRSASEALAVRCIFK